MLQKQKRRAANRFQLNNRRSIALNVKVLRRQIQWQAKKRPEFPPAFAI
jgi:hypothetical protein